MDKTDWELYEKLSRLQWLLQRHHLQTHAQRGPMADPTRGQGRVLAMLKLQPEISSKDLSYLLGIRQQSLNELLNKLEKGGYITRSPSDADKRVILIRPTEKGKHEQPESMDFTAIFGCLNQEEQAAFSEYLDRVIASLENLLGDDADEAAASDWEKSARERFGDERFEFLRTVRPFHHRPDPHDGWHGYPGPMPRPEHFPHDYDGPFPERRDGFPGEGWDRRQTPPLPKRPKDPDPE